MAAVAAGQLHPRTLQAQELPALSAQTLHYLRTLPNLAARIADETSAVRAPPKTAFQVRARGKKGWRTWVCGGVGLTTG